MHALVLSLLSLVQPASAADPALATRLVPGGTVVATEPDEVKVRTPSGTLVEVELHADGTLDEAEGDASTGGDVFRPDGGLLPLDAIVAKATAQGHVVAGDWSFEHHATSGWVYELQAFDQGRERELIVRASDGAIVATRDDG